MTVKEYLSQAFGLNEMINSKMEQADELRELAEKATYRMQLAKAYGAKQNSPLENAIVNMVDLEYEIDTDIDRLVDLKRELMHVINRVEKPQYRLLLEKRYLLFKTWDAVAKDLGCELRWVHRLHNCALAEVEKIIGGNPERVSQSH
jgi:hypothetical protein